MKGRDMRSYVSSSVTDEGSPKNIEICLFERKTASRNFVKITDMITENYADFIMAGSKTEAKNRLTV